MKRICWFILFLCVSIQPLKLQAQQASIGDQFINDVNSFVSDGVSFYGAPLEFNSSEWIYTSSFLLGSYLIMTQDEYLNKRWSRQDAKTKNQDAWDTFYYYGTVEWVYLFASSTYASGLVFKQKNVRELGLLWLKSVSYSGLLVESIRILAGRSRPYSGKGAWHYNGPTMDNLNQSFASGHTTVAFATSTVFAEYFDTFYSRIFFYGLAGLTAFTRVYNNQHWVSDIVVGGAIGLASGLFVMNKFSISESLGISKNIQILPGANKINLVWKL